MQNIKRGSIPAGEKTLYLLTLLAHMFLYQPTFSQPHLRYCISVSKLLDDSQYDCLDSLHMFFPPPQLSQTSEQPIFSI